MEIMSVKKLSVALVLAFLLVPLVLSAPVQPTPTDASEPSSELAQNMTDGCVPDGDYNSETDYFPEKTMVQYAFGWNIEYHNNYKVINVTEPWTGANERFQYVLVQCGTPAPDGYPDAQVIEVPIDRIVTMSTTHLPHIVQLGVLDSLVGIDSIGYVNTQVVIDRYNEGKVAEVGNGPDVNVERVLELDPDVVMSFSSGSPEFDAHPKLLEAGLKVAMNAEWMEQSPLGRAEWIKFTAMFYNREAQGNEVFSGIEERYNNLLQHIADEVPALDERPTTFANTPFQGTWYMPGGKSFAARLMDDAGAHYLWRDDDSNGSLTLDFEAVYDRAVDADVWLNAGQGMQSVDDLIASDERFADFTAAKRGKIYANDARVSAGGGNDYYENGVTNPDVLLADLVKIMYPTLLPDHTLTYYRRLTPSSTYVTHVFLPLVRVQD